VTMKKKDRNMIMPEQVDSWKENAKHIPQQEGSRIELKRKINERKKELKTKKEQQSVPTTNAKEKKSISLIRTNSVKTKSIRCNKVNMNGPAPVITGDSSHILCPCGSNVVIFYLQTGFIENQFTQHRYSITNIYINNRDPMQIISCSSKEIIFWEYSDLTVVKRLDLSFCTQSMYINPCNCQEFYYTRLKEKASDTIQGSVKSATAELVKWNINDLDNHQVIGDVTLHPKCVAVSHNGEHVVYTFNDRLCVFPGPTESFSYSEANITCLSLHPKELVVATGDQEGKIIMWHNLLEEGKHVCVKRHWHTEPVVDLVFSNDGNYLYSGGNENVLVVWQLGTHDKSFVPRMGGAVRHLSQSPDDEFLCVSLTNNVLKIISNSTNTLRRAIRHVSRGHGLPVGIKYQPSMQCLVFNGSPDGVLQFYNPNGDSVKLSLDLIGENEVSSVLDQHVYPTRVLKIAISDDGAWMVSLDERQDRILPTERKLKFWRCHRRSTYSLSTLADPPHKGEVTSLCFRPGYASEQHNYMVLSAATDGEVKTWVDVESGDEEKSYAWQIHSIGSYGSRSCTGACFSQNGETLAVLCSSVTIWDPDNLTFNRCLEFNAKNEKIQSIEFACNESSNYLIGHSEHYLIVWDMSTCDIAWMLQMNVLSIVPDPYSRYCAALFRYPHSEKEANNASLYLFDPSSPSPKHLIRKVIPKNNGSISAAVFTPPDRKSVCDENIWSQTGQLYFLSNKTVIYRLQSISEEASGDVDNVKGEEIAGKECIMSSGFADVFGALSDEVANEDDDKTSRKVLGNPSGIFVRKMLRTPANTLPSTDILCKAYMKTLLLPKASEEVDDSDETDKLEKHQDVRTFTNDVIVNEDISIADTTSFSPSKELLKKLRQLRFDFVQPIT